MIDSSNTGDLLGDGLSRLALAICILVAVLMLVPFRLVNIGFGALIGVAGGLQTPAVAASASQPKVGALLAPACLPPQAPATADASRPYIAELLTQARSWLGTRYVFGGCSTSGIDCSCFVRTVFRSAGIDLPRTSQLQYNATVGRGLAVSNPEPSDVVFSSAPTSTPAKTGRTWASCLGWTATGSSG